MGRCVGVGWEQGSGGNHHTTNPGKYFTTVIFQSLSPRTKAWVSFDLETWYIWTLEEGASQLEASGWGDCGML